MATEPKPPSIPAPAQAGENAPSERPGYARLAKRISAVTTNCLLTGLVLVAGLGFGRQVLRWWAEGDSGPAAGSGPVPAADGLGDPSRLHVLQFGDQPWSLRRQLVAGDRQAAAEALRSNCRDAVRRAQLPNQRPGKAENELLGRLAAENPVDEQPGRWQLYQRNHVFPMVVGVRQPLGAANSATRTEGAAGGRRVVTWGLAVPAGPDAWALCSFQPEPASSGATAILSAEPLPPECSKTLSLRVAGGGAVVAFRGRADARTWIHFYDQWFARHNWKVVADWRRTGPAWYVRYAAPGRDPAALVDLRFGPDDRGQLAGLLIATPSSDGRGPHWPPSRRTDGQTQSSD